MKKTSSVRESKETERSWSPSSPSPFGVVETDGPLPAPGGKEELAKLRTHMEPGMGKKEILHGEKGAGVFEKVEVEGPGIKLPLAPAAESPLDAKKEGKDPGGADPGIPDHDHVEKVGRDDAPGTGSCNDRGAEEAKIRSMRQIEERLAEGSPHIADVSAEGDGKEASHAPSPSVRRRRGAASGCVPPPP